MLWRVGVVVIALAMSGPAAAQSDLENGFAGALHGCEQWVLEPATWADGLDKFSSKLGLATRPDG
jgi:hypothetical protein